MPVAWHQFGDRARLDQALAVELSRQLRSSLSERQRALLAVSGGSTPTGLFKQLAAQDLDWSRVVVTLVDERFVAADHADSNEALVRERLLQGPAQAASWLPAYAPGEPDRAAAQWGQALQSLMPASALVLGMGGDGHTASWFPDSPQLATVIDPATEAVTAVVTTPSSPHRRLTLTLPAVMRSEQLVLHITGADKRAKLEANLSGKLNDPIAAIVNRAGVTVDVYWAP